MTDRRRTSRDPGRGGNTGALERTRRSTQRRLIRTIVLGTAAVAAAIYWLARELGIDSEELLDYALTSLMLVGAMVVLALGGALALRGIRYLLDGRRRK